MSEDIIQKIQQVYQEEGLEGESLRNELLRFAIVEELISSNKSSQTYGLSLDELYTLAKDTTEDVLGPMKISLDNYGRCYQLSFAKPLFALLEELELIEECHSGLPYREAFLVGANQLRQRLLSEEIKKITFRHIEQYMDLLSDLLQIYKDFEITLFSASNEAKDMASLLFPLVHHIGLEESINIRNYRGQGVVSFSPFLPNKRDYEDEIEVLNTICSGGEGGPQGLFFFDMRCLVMHKERGSLRDVFADPYVYKIDEWLPLGIGSFERGLERRENMSASFMGQLEDSFSKIILPPINRQEFLADREKSLMKHGTLDALTKGEQPFSEMAQEERDSLWKDCSSSKESLSYASQVNPQAIEAYKAMHHESSTLDDAALWHIYFLSKEGAIYRRFIDHLCADDHSWKEQLYISLYRPEKDAALEQEWANEYEEAYASYKSVLEKITKEWNKAQQDLAEKFGKSL